MTWNFNFLGFVNAYKTEQFNMCMKQSYFAFVSFVTHNTFWREISLKYFLSSCKASKRKIVHNSLRFCFLQRSVKCLWWVMTLKINWLELLYMNALFFSRWWWDNTWFSFNDYEIVIHNWHTHICVPTWQWHLMHIFIIAQQQFFTRQINLPLFWVFCSRQISALFSENSSCT